MDKNYTERQTEPIRGWLTAFLLQLNPLLETLVSSSPARYRYRLQAACIICRYADRLEVCFYDSPSVKRCQRIEIFLHKKKKEEIIVI